MQTAAGGAMGANGALGARARRDSTTRCWTATRPGITSPGSVSARKALTNGSLQPSSASEEGNSDAEAPSCSTSDSRNSLP